MQFGSRLVRASGYAGRVCLIDEVELIGSYSALQRLKSYIEIGRMMAGSNALDCPGVVVVLTITDDYGSAILRGKGDIGSIVAYWQERCRDGRELREYSPLIGMLAIQKGKDFLEPLDENKLRNLEQRLRELYKIAYDWTPPEPKPFGHLSSTTVRNHIKFWLTSWDIQRLYPELTAELETRLSTTTTPNQSTLKTLEQM